MQRDGRSAAVLIVCDPNLHDQVRAVIAEGLASAVCYCWCKGDARGAAKLRKLICSGEWDLLVSVYSDYIFSGDELRQVRIPLNLHPALPTCPGVGYDIQPLIEAHPIFGGTLHWMIPQIDAGAVIRTLEYPLPSEWDYQTLRAANQSVVLRMLHQLVQFWSASYSLESFEAALNQEVTAATQWHGSYLSKRELARIILELKDRDPQRFESIGFPLDLLCEADGCNVYPASPPRCISRSV